jgi:hypothetical protein
VTYIIHFASGRSQRIDGLKPINAGAGTIFVDPTVPVVQNMPIEPVVIVPHENVEFIEREGGSAGILQPDMLGRRAGGIIV